jgi:hypothetical protein
MCVTCVLTSHVGTPLQYLWLSLSLEQKVAVTTRMARVFASLQATPVPKTDKPFGAFAFADPVDVGSAATITASAFHYGGPHATLADLYAAYLHTHYDALVHKATRLEGWKGSDVTLGNGRTLDLADAIREFMGKFDGDAAWRAELFAGMDETPTFIHGDWSESSAPAAVRPGADGAADEANVLVDPDTLEITAVLDFEFAQCGPPLDEFFQSWAPIGLLVEGSRARPADTAEAAEFDARQGLLFRDAAPLPAGAPEQCVYVAAIVAELKMCGARGPWSYDPQVVDRQANVYWFAQELCTGPFWREKFWTDESERMQKRRADMMAETRTGLEGDMRRWLKA